MKGIKEVEIDGKIIYLKKSFGEHRVVYPMKTEGKINWKNILIGGSWFNFIKLLFIIGVLLFLAYSYKTDMNNCIDFAMENYCNFNKIR